MSTQTKTHVNTKNIRVNANPTYKHTQTTIRINTKKNTQKHK